MAYTCPLCTATANRKGRPFDEPGAVVRHIDAKSDESHRGERGKDYLDEIGTGSPTGDVKAELEAADGLRFSTVDVIDELDEQDQAETWADQAGGAYEEPGPDPNTPPSECASCGESRQKKFVGPEGVKRLSDDGLIKLQSGRVVGLEENDRFCLECGTITEPTGETHR